MKNFLLIIESTHKINAINSLLVQGGHSEFKVVATRGRIRDLPSDRMGINLNDYSFEEVDVLPSVTNYIKEMSCKFGTTFICTDADNEGEKIAFDITNLVENSVKRSVIKAYTPEALTFALENSIKLDESKIKAQVAKRIFDRVVSSDLAKTNLPDSLDHSGIGRIITPVLSLISESKPKSGVVYRDFESKGDIVRFIVDCHGLTKEEVSSVAEIVSGVGDIEFSLEEQKDMIDSSTFWNGKQAMVNIASSLNMAVKEVFDHLQDLYTQGMISYFRTDTCDLSKDDASKLTKIAMEHGIGIDAESSIIDRSILGNKRLSALEMQQHSHGALIPLSSSIDPTLPLSMLSDRDKVYSLLLRHSLKVMKKPARLTEKVFTPNVNKSSVFFNTLNKYDVKFKSVSRTIQAQGRPVAPYYPETNPNGVSLGTKKIDRNCGYRVIQPDLMVSMVLIKHGLSRPSTFAYHSDRIAKNFINERNELNNRGSKALQSAKGVSTALCSPKTYHSLESIFSQQGFSITKILDETLSIVGINKNSIKEETGKEKSNDYSPFG
ncbi:DNA topoisomerase [Vibrio splendidus]|nr:DNA topoisomerase [Vibrio splendidus]MCC4883249.1 hypothetical protein [Vibrio splendidus]